MQNRLHLPRIFSMRVLVFSLLVLVVASVLVTFVIGRRDLGAYRRGQASWKAEVVDKLGAKTTYQYDSLARRLNRTDPLGNVTTYQYDANGNRVSVTDPLGRTTTYSYDSLNRLVTTPYNTSSDSLRRALQSVSVHSWLLLGVERARLANAHASSPVDSHDYQQRLDELRGKEPLILKEYPTEEFSLDEFAPAAVLDAPGRSSLQLQSASKVSSIASDARTDPTSARANMTVPPPPDQQSPFSPAFWVSLSTVCIAAIAMLSTVTLGWRADKRAVRELHLKLSEAEQKTQEYSLKLIEAETKLGKSFFHGSK